MRTHLRITDGNASCASASIGRWKPSASIRGTRAANRSMVSSKWVKPCRTWPADCQAHSHRRAARAPRRRRHGVARHSVPGSSRHAAEQPLRRASSQQHVALRRRPARNARHAAAAARASPPCAAVRAAMPARRPAQSAIQGHSAQAGAAGVHTVAPRSNSAWAKSDGRARRRRIVAELRRPGRAARGLACRHSFAHREQPRHHALDVAVHRHRRHAERDRADRRGGVDRRCPAARAARPGRAGTRRPRPPPGAGVQVAGTRVVAKAGPGSEHRLQRRGGQRLDGGKAA